MFHFFYSLQGDRKVREGGTETGSGRPVCLNTEDASIRTEGQPVVSIDAKKCEFVGDFNNTRREWYALGEAPLVNVYDFPKSIPPFEQGL